jgi:membrane fusion protein, heavy metal efflux system
MQNNRYSLLLVLFCGLISCHKPTHPDPVPYDSTGNIQAISLSDKSFKEINLRFEKVQIRKSLYEIAASGILIIPSESNRIITAPFNGKIDYLYIQKDPKIKKGQRIAIIQNIDFITLQQEFLEAKNQFDYFKEEYTRQGDLTVENATSIKKMQQAKRDYQTAELHYYALSLKLKLLGINPDALSVNTIIPYLTIYSPFEGTNIKILKPDGSFIQAGDAIAEIYSSRKPVVSIYINEMHYQKIQTGSIVDCYLASDTLTHLKGTIIGIQKEIDPVSKEGMLFAQINDSTLSLIPGMGVKCKIQIQGDSTCWVRSSSIINDDKKNYIFLKHQGLLLRVPIRKGAVTGSETEIFDFPAAASDSLVISGVKRLHSIFKIQ